MENDNTRRHFFKQLMLGSLALYLLPTLHSCKEAKKLALTPGEGSEPFSVWQEIIEALGYSIDNLPALRKHIVATKDPQKITEFVLKSLCIVPHHKNYFGYKFSSQPLYGTDVALRTGLASPREKAEILKDMLLEAGFEARVVSENLDLNEAEVKEILFNQRKVSFQPNIPNKQYKIWQKRLGLNKIPQSVNYLQDITTEANELANKLLAELSDDQKQKGDTLKYNFSANEVPAVLLNRDGKEELIHVFDASIPFGNAHPKNASKKYGIISKFSNPDEDISITLSYTTAFDLREKKTLLLGKWKTSQLIGNQLKLGFLNNMSFEDSVLKTISDISSFTPVMALQDLNKDKEYLENNSYLGEPINLSAEKLINPDFVIIKEEKSVRSSKAKSIVDIEVKANPKAFPNVSLELIPRDKNGKIVEGLLANDFSIQDNGKEVKGYLSQNKIAPKILFLFDASLSMPSEYRGKGAEKFQKDLEEKIKIKYPNAYVEIKSTTSQVYTSHLKAANQNYDLILYATDGHNSDKFNPKTEQIFKQGPKTLYIKMYDNYNPDYISVENIANNTGAEVIDGKDQEKTISKILHYLKSLPLPVYRFNYSSFNIEEDHNVEVSVVETKKTGTDSFKFSPMLDESLGNRIVGLYLDINISYDRKYSRVLAGWDRNLSNQNPTNEMVQEVHEFMLGSNVISFEREGATTSVRLEEYLKALMSNKDWFEAQRNGDTQKAIEALSEGVHDYPQVLLSMMQPLENAFDKNAITYPTGYRIGILKTKPGLYNENSIFSFDYLRSSNYVSITKNNKDAFSETTRKTAQFAILESKVFESSTFTELQKKPLVVTTSQKFKDVLYDRNFGDSLSYYRLYINSGRDIKFVDIDSKSKSFWNINYNTGELYGVLPDQTGGGNNTVKAQLLALKEVMKQYDKLYSSLGMAATLSGSGVMVGIATAYSKTLVKLIAFATESVIIMDANLKDINGKLDLALQELACSIVKEIIMAIFGVFREGAANLISGLENLIGMMGGNFSVVPCPSM